MTTALKLRRGTTSQHSTFTGADGEVTVDTTKKTVVVHDGATAGGFPLARTSGSESLAINSTTPSQVLGYEKLGVLGSAGFKTSSGSALGLWNTASPGLMSFYTDTGTPSGSISGSGGSLSISAGNNLNLSAPGASVITVNTNSAERMRINSSGLVGIGTNNPQRILDAHGAAGTGGGEVGIRLVDTTTSFGIQLIRTGGTFSYNGIGANEGVVYSSNTLTLASDSNTNMKFATGGAERMRINSSGNLLAGTTDNNANGRGSATRTVIASPSSGGGDTLGLLQVANTSFNIASLVNTTSGTRYHIGFGDGATWAERGTISTNGTSTTYSTSSDYRLKENVAPMTGALTKVSQLRPVTYTWKENGSHGEGFIAHELQEVLPDAVTGEKDATRIEKYEIEPARKVTVTKQRQVTEKVMVKQHSIDCVAGVYTACIHDVEVDQPVMEQKPVFNEDGTPHMVLSVPEQPEQLDEEGNVISPATPAQYVQATISVPVMEDYETEEEIPAVMGEREVPAYQGIDTSFLVGTLTAAIQELNAKVEALEAQLASSN